MIQQRMQCVGMERRDTDCSVSSTQQLNFRSRQAIAFVEDQNFGNAVEAQLFQYTLDGSDVCITIPYSGIHHVQEEICVAKFFQCCAKCHQKVFGKIANEPDRVGDDDFTVVGKSKSSAGGIECFEHTVIGANAAVRQYIQECRFPGVGVTDDRNDWQSLPGTPSAALILMSRK